MPCCPITNNVHICCPEPVLETRRFFRCKKCKCKRLHDVTHYEWYGPTIECRKCGKKTYCE